jgi:phosphoglycolate phosphatase
LILWDIDGTLLAGGPVAREAFGDAVTRVTGRDAGDHGVRMSGKTDPQIALEIMERAGVPVEDARSHLPKVLLALEEGLGAQAGRLRDEGRVHPGVPRLLQTLSREPRVLQSVLTGNLKANARVKLASFGLDRLVDLEVGAFGSDHHDRTELIPIALQRVELHHGWRLEAHDVWVVGDTPRDLEAAGAAGARCLLVATGRFRVEELVGIGADAVLPDLGDELHVLEILLG